MATIIRPELSEKNKYWVSKHRHYELKHFCLQYPSWKKASVNTSFISATKFDAVRSDNTRSDPTANVAIRRNDILSKIELIEDAVMETDQDLHEYILKAVTEGLSYTQLKSRLDIPCSRDTYYDRYRRFFWILDKLKD